MACIYHESLRRAVARAGHRDPALSTRSIDVT